MASKHIRLGILDEFKCSGSECPASCCSYGWNIDVDDETYIRWQQADTENRERDLLESLTVKYGTNERRLKHINNQCTHLSDQGLCKVQMKLGHEFLPKTCQKYPRIAWSTGKYSAESLYLSCPEVIELLLAANDEKLFEIGKKAKTKNIEMGDPEIPDEFGSLLDEYLSQVMQNNKYPINILLLTITKKLIDISLLSQQGALGITELQKELSGVSRQIKATQNQFNNNELSNTAADSGRFWHLVYLMGKLEKILPSKLDLYQDRIFEKIEECDKSDESFVSIGKDIKSYRNSFLNKLPGFYRDFMGRYLRVKFINNAFPRSPVEGNLVAGLLYCVLPHAYIQLYVWVAAMAKGSLTEQDVIDIIYSVERRFDHNEKIYKFLSEHPELLRIDTYYTCLTDV